MRIIVSGLFAISICAFSYNTHAGENMPHMTEEEKIAFISVFAEAMGKKVDPNNPKTIQAAEAFIVADAAKSFAFTKIHGVTLEYCKNDESLIAAMNTYKEKAANFISLGANYYKNGYDLTIGEKKLKKSGKELTEALDEMLENMRQELASADEPQLAEKCKESTEALKMLAVAYGG